jgi:hypothetical protein
MRIQNAAMTYCKVRITTGAIISMVVGVLLLIIGIYLRRSLADTDKWTPIDAKIKTCVEIERKRDKKTYWDSVCRAEFAVGGKKYITNVSGSNVQYDSREAAAAGWKALVGTTKQVFYNPLDPAQTTETRNQEDYVVVATFVIGALLGLGGAVAYKLRSNPIMCGLQMASNVGRLFD